MKKGDKVVVLRTSWTAREIDIIGEVKVPFTVGHILTIYEVHRGGESFQLVNNGDFYPTGMVAVIPEIKVGDHVRFKKGEASSTEWGTFTVAGPETITTGKNLVTNVQSIFDGKKQLIAKARINDLYWYPITMLQVVDEAPEKRAIREGDWVVLTKGAGWNSVGQMDCYHGRCVQVRSILGDDLKFNDDGGWLFSLSCARLANHQEIENAIKHRFQRGDVVYNNDDGYYYKVIVTVGDSSTIMDQSGVITTVNTNSLKLSHNRKSDILTSFPPIPITSIEYTHQQKVKEKPTSIIRFGAKQVKKRSVKVYSFKTILKPKSV